ncbi:uncharacterized protein [Antedon mediterranea]|uniref:uncharacterized protein n=1 Tax=Antedon mediterranea TaxID=105859 RepID=UPI003AF82EA0
MKVNLLVTSSFLTKDQLSSSGKKFLKTRNSTGTSIQLKAAFSFEVLLLLLPDAKLETQTKIKYSPSKAHFKLTDKSAVVSVCMSVTWLERKNIDDVKKSLEVNLKELKNATKKAIKKSDKSIMFVWTESPRFADLVYNAWENIKHGLKANTMLIVVLVEKEQHFN